MPIEKKLTQVVLQDWPSWGLQGEPRIVGKPQQGLNHKVQLLAVDSRHYILKIFTEPSANSIEIQRCAARFALSPKVVYSAPCGAYLLMDYVEQADFHQASLDMHALLSKLAATLTKLHCLDWSTLFSAQADFELLRHCDSYLEGMQAKEGSAGSAALLDENLQANLHKKQAELLPALKYLTADDTPKVLCHNDLVRENCLISDHQLLFIDWDYACPNNPWFDLAALIYYWDLSEAHAQQLLSLYHPQFSKQYGKPIYWAALCAVVWLDVLWHANRQSTKQADDSLRGSAKLDSKLLDLANFRANFSTAISSRAEL